VGVLLGLAHLAPALPPSSHEVGARIGGGIGAGLAAPYARDFAVRLWRALRKRVIKEIDEG
jgi:hypothetical protein